MGTPSFVPRSSQPQCRTGFPPARTLGLERRGTHLRIASLSTWRRVRRSRQRRPCVWRGSRKKKLRRQDWRSRQSWVRGLPSRRRTSSHSLQCGFVTMRRSPSWRRTSAPTSSIRGGSKRLEEGLDPGESAGPPPEQAAHRDRQGRSRIWARGVYHTLPYACGLHSGGRRCHSGLPATAHRRAGKGARPGTVYDAHLARGRGGAGSTPCDVHWDVPLHGRRDAPRGA